MAAQNSDSADQQLALLQDQLTVLLSRYTPDHPDVIKTQSQIAELKRRMAEPVKGTPRPIPTPRLPTSRLRFRRCEQK